LAAELNLVGALGASLSDLVFHRIRDTVLAKLNHIGTANETKFIVP
jgi:hypothetical protein